MKIKTGNISSIILIVLWMSGISVVNGFWWTVLTIIIPPVGIYFGVEVFLKFFGVL